MSNDPMYQFIEKMGSEYLGDFKTQLEKFTAEITSEHIRTNADLNLLIANAAKKNNLNPDQIQRIIEEANNSVHLYYYNKQKNNDVRDVRFPIARKNKINEILTGEKPTTDLKKTAFYPGTSSMEKVASDESDEGFDIVKEYVSPIKIRDRYSEVEAFKEKVKAEQLIESLEKEAFAIKDGMSKIASVLIKNELVNKGSAQAIAGFLFKEASVRFVDSFENVFAANVAREISQHHIPEDFEQELFLTEKKASEFSLGKFSFLNEKPTFTTAIVDGEIFKDIDSLKKIAGELSNKFDKGLELREKVAKIIEKIKSTKRGSN